jgi:hypothetical protein
MVKSANREITGPDAVTGGAAAAAGGNAAGDGGGPGGPAARVPLRELMDDRLLDALLERSRDEAGGLRLTGEGSDLPARVSRGLGERACLPGIVATWRIGRHGRARQIPATSRG